MLDFNSILEKEESLDPENWDEMRNIGHKMVDDMMDFLQHIRERPSWNDPTENMQNISGQPLPDKPQELTDIYEDFKENILPFPKGNIHPRFWAWVQGTGTPTAMMADMLASGMNSNVTIGDHSAMYVDKLVVDWCKQLLGFPASASGLLVSGGSLANITAIIVARNAFGNNNIRKHGLRAEGGQLLMYGSTETHSCLQKAAEVIGIGSDAFRKVPINAQYQMDINALKDMIAIDRKKGHIPFCIIGNAGTVNTGAIDPLADILVICKEEKLWFHVDGAFGSLAKLVPDYQVVLKPIEEADSVAFDLHKWMYMPYEAGCVIIKNAEFHRNSFAMQPNYLLNHERGLAAGPDPITNYGMELSRGFKALKVWMCLREHGADKFARLIRQNIAQCYYLGHLIEAAPLLELVTPVTMNIVCFRYNPGGISDEKLNAINKEILMRLQEDGLHSPSCTMLHGKYVIRVANVNHRSRKEDFEALVGDVVRLGSLQSEFFK